MFLLPAQDANMRTLSNHGSMIISPCQPECCCR